MANVKVYFFIYSLILFTLFIPQSTVLGSGNPDVFYGHNSLNPLSVNKGTNIISLPGGNKSLTDGNGITYLTNDHLGSVRLALNTDNTVSRNHELHPFWRL